MNVDPEFIERLLDVLDEIDATSPAPVPMDQLRVRGRALRDDLRDALDAHNKAVR